MNEQNKQIIEALIFATDKPLSLSEIDELLGGQGAKTIKEKIEELNAEYEAGQRAYRIKEIAGGFVVAILEEFAPWLKKLYQTRISEKLSASALETLAIIAYKQPITKPTIEAVRGVNIDAVIKKLLEKGLIKISGRKDAPGRPFIYSTTKEFLKHFGLGRIEELPPIEQFASQDVLLNTDNFLAKREEELEKLGSEESEKGT